jgi:transposase
MVGVLDVPAADRVELERLARSSVEPHRRVVQAKALLALAEGTSVRSTAADLGTYPNTVARWRDKYLSGGIDAVGSIAAGRGRKKRVAQSVVEAIVDDTLHTVPEDGSTQWSTRTMAARHGVSRDFVSRIWRARKIRPWRVELFKLSTDPDFEAKLVDVVGLYLDPPERAVVLCVDEKSQTQALDRTQPSLPLVPGRAGTMTHDYKRNGTTTIFAALDVATGRVLQHCRPRRRHQDFLFFLKLIDLHVPRHLEVHLVVDNLNTHSHDKVAKWLAHPKRRRFHLHFTPTSSSWLNLVERWFKEITDKRIRRGSFDSVDELVAAIDHWSEHWNDDPKPFVWHRPAAEIIAKVRRGRAALDRVTKSATDH